MSPASASSFPFVSSFCSAAALPGKMPMISTSPRLKFLATCSSMGRDGAMIVWSTLASSFCSPETWGSSRSTMGARMKIALKGCLLVSKSLPSASCKKGRLRLAWKLSTWRPKWLRLTRTSRPPISSWPPSFVRFADSASSIRPAHVPHVGFRDTLLNC
jgi:hypothetical protein